MFVDIHTHVDNQAVIKIIDGVSEKILKTWGVHPWDVKNARNDNMSINIYFAIGEVGLDKVHKDTYEKQIEVFEEMIRLSESYRKPVIVHCVRAYSEIIEIRKKTRATMPWIIHGFNSSVETMRQLLKYDMYISLGEVLYRNENQAVKILKNIPIERLFLETDVSGRDIRDVYTKAANLMGCEVEFLENKIFENYGRLEAAH
jgi:TatD DNase family protein